MQLETQWHLKSMARYYELKKNQTILEHLQRHRIFMNPTKIKQTEAIVAFFWYSCMSSSTVGKMPQQRLSLALTLTVSHMLPYAAEAHKSNHSLMWEQHSLGNQKQTLPDE
eukprot:10675923-Ditylum_brightwellii.AAC.2